MLLCVFVEFWPRLYSVCMLIIMMFAPLIYIQSYRVCAAPTFAEGKLASSWTRTNKSGRYDNNYPYADVFVAEEKDGYMVDQLNCAHPIEVFKPIVYKPVYNGSFHVAFPNNPQKVLDGAFGDDWKTPDSGHKKHGNTSCRNGGIKFTK